MKRDKVYIMQLLAAQPASSFIVSTPGGPPALVAREHVRLPDLASIFAEVGVGSMRANTASMTEMVSAAVFPTSLAASVTRDLRL